MSDMYHHSYPSYMKLNAGVQAVEEAARTGESVYALKSKGFGDVPSEDDLIIDPTAECNHVSSVTQTLDERNVVHEIETKFLLLNHFMLAVDWNKPTEEQDSDVRKALEDVNILKQQCATLLAKPAFRLAISPEKAVALYKITTIFDTIIAFETSISRGNHMFSDSCELARQKGSSSWNDWLKNSVIGLDGWVVIVQKIPQVGDMITRRLCAEYESFEEEYEEYDLVTIEGPGLPSPGDLYTHMTWADFTTESGKEVLFAPRKTFDHKGYKVECISNDVAKAFIGPEIEDISAGMQTFPFFKFAVAYRPHPVSVKLGKSSNDLDLKDL